MCQLRAKDSPKQLKETSHAHPVSIAVVAVLVVAAWASIPTVAKQDGIVSVDPTSLTVTKTNLPAEQYDAF